MSMMLSAVFGILEAFFDTFHVNFNDQQFMNPWHFSSPLKEHSGNKWPTIPCMQALEYRDYQTEGVQLKDMVSGA